ncbi:MAG: arylsulfatase [Halieaceae bacterium]|nr:arylsulfatase [Halieaceae bacterium]MDG1931559.1 sulfatase-like hydrolase/transferase [Luminiphilus sp.]MDG2036802.1 sulfatase-like hydrolase/transferase [Luminiphilus sp.]|tara:strand:+ start:1090 stop:2529 length:1440 start_codon:yes stop_codon:yes gene_type:complete
MKPAAPPFFLTGLTILLLALTPSQGTAEASTAEDIAGKPNIVLVLMDNFGWGEVGVYGGGVMRGAPTPNIDSIAAQGMRLTNFNVEAECTPSRSALLTGRYGIRTRQRENSPPRGVWYGITKWEITLAELLEQQGYISGIFGKWHLGDTEGRFPTDQGFDEWIGLPRSSDRAFWPDSNSFQPDAHPDIRFAYVMSSRKGEEPTDIEVFDRAKRTVMDREITDNTLDFIERQASSQQPFFAFVTYTQTHEPVDPHPDFYGSTGHGSFADVLAQTDTYVGELLSKLDDLGLSDDTIFIFTSDNGREGVPRSFGFTGPWRSGMFSPYEGSLRVPFIIRWPEKIPAQRVSNEVVHQLDVFPTIAKFVGAETPQDRVLDGVDQSRFFMGKTDDSARESLVIYIGNTLFGAKWRDWKILLKEMDSDTYAVQDIAYPSIYNLIVDPKEEVPELNYLNDTWIDFPLYQVIEDHEASLANDPQLPIGD